MVDVVSAISAAASVKAPTTIDLADSEHPPVSASPCFGVRDLLPRVLGDLVSLFKRNSREAASAVYQRRLNC